MERDAIAALVGNAEAAAGRSDWAKSASIWQEVIRQAPDYPKCFNKAAVALRKAGLFDESDAVMHDAITVLGPVPEYYIILGDTAMDRRRWRAALKHWKDLRDLDERNPRGYYRAVQAHLALNNADQAEALCATGLSVFPREKHLLILHVKTAANSGTMREVVARVKRAARLHPGDAEIAQLLADTTGITSDLAHSDGKPLTVAAIENHLDKLQGSSTAVKLQRRIDGAREAWQIGLTLGQYGGLQRHFDLARTDDRLQRVLAGTTDRDRGRAPGTPIRVVFFFPHVTQVDHLTPLFERMQRDPRFVPMILCSRSKKLVQADSFEFFSQKYPAADGWRVVDGGADINQNVSFYELDADLVFFHTPYSLNSDRPFYLRADFAARHCMVAHVTYGYPLLTLDAHNSHVYAGDHVRKCDMVFAESPVCLEPYGRFVGKEKVFVTGYTKADEFRRHLQPGSFETIAAGPKPLDVMWTPHWQLPGDSRGDTETSNFLRYSDVMLRMAARSDIQLHVRPHPLLRLRLNATGILPFEEYDAVLEQFRVAGAKVYPADEGVSYVPALMKTAVLVSDFSSLVAEFTITKRPIVFCRTDDVWTNGKWIGAFGKQLIENCCYVVDDEAGLEARLDELVRTRKHPMAAQMAEFVDRNELFPAGSAADRICDLLDRSFNHAELAQV